MTAMLYSIKHWLARKYLQRTLRNLAEFTAVSLNRYMPGNEAYDIFSKHGYHLLRKHYYLPIPEQSDLDDAFWEKRSELIGIEMNDAGALDLLENVFPRYVDEFRQQFPLHQSTDTSRFYLINGAFMAVDAHVYYMFIRHFKPKRIV